MRENVPLPLPFLMQAGLDKCLRFMSNSCQELAQLADVLTSDSPYEYDPNFLSRLTLEEFNYLWDVMEYKRLVREELTERVSTALMRSLSGRIH